MPNDDLISRSALLEIYKKWLPQLTKPEDAGDRNGVETCIAVLEEAPAVDAEPVRHGKWIETYAYGAWIYDCPFCDDGYATKEREKKPVNFCHNCGAKMDLEE